MKTELLGPLLVALAVLFAGYYVGSADERGMETCVDTYLILKDGYDVRPQADSEEQQHAQFYLLCRGLG